MGALRWRLADEFGEGNGGVVRLLSQGNVVVGLEVGDVAVEVGTDVHSSAGTDNERLAEGKAGINFVV